MQLPEWPPEGIDADRPSAARIYDYLLGGYHNFAVDRAVADQVIEVMPDAVTQAQANRAFLHRAVRFLVAAGVRQFLDLGSGIPTLGNVHEIAQRADPECRVVYVDIDTVAVAHSRHLLAGNEYTAVVQEDMRNPAGILADAGLRAVIDLGRPVAVLMVAVLHAIPDADDPARIVARFRDGVAAGSYLVVAHGTAESRPEVSARMVEISKRTPTPLTLRSRQQVQALFGGFELVEPGVVWAPLWHPDSPHQVPEHPEYSGNLVGVGRRR
jgi:S-adenosyl methyltransferase